MRPEWQAFLTQQGFSDDGEHFGHLAAELLAARDDTVLAPLADFGVLRASGEDAATFLHNLLTNDVKQLGPDAVRRAAMCTAKGRMIANFLLWRDHNGNILIALARDIASGILKKLSMYILRSKVKLTDASDEYVLLGLAGARAENIVQSLAPASPFPMQVVPCDAGQVLRLDERQFILALAPGNATATWTSLAAQARPVGAAAWRWLEIVAGQPRIVAATQEAFIPQMVNMETAAVGGVSFTKGCYPGQEIVARTQYLGKVKRRMYRAQCATALVPGTHVYAPETGDQHCGAIVTCAPAPSDGHECLVVVQASCAETGEVHVGAQDGPRLNFLALPYTVG